MGFLGYNPGQGGADPQGRHWVAQLPALTHPLAEILTAAAPLMSLWDTEQRFPGLPLYSGGLLDSWPAVAVDALAICREEWPYVQAHVAHTKGGKSHG